MQWWLDNANAGEFDNNKGYYRTDAMDDYTYRMGQNLYTAYQNKQNLAQEYQTAQERLKAQTAQAQAQSYAEKMLMQKYLPSLMNKYGYAGNVGISDNAALGLNRNYNNSVNSIASNYNQSMQDLTNDYNANKLAIDTATSERNDAILTEQNNVKQNLASEWYAKFYEDYQNLLNDEDTSEDDWNKFIEKIEKNEVLGMYKDLLYDDIVESRDNYVKTKEQENIDLEITSGKQTISYNGTDYKLIGALSANANEITNNDSFTKALKQLGYTDPYDVNIPNGTTIKIKCDKSGTDKYNFWDDTFGAGIFLKSLWGNSGWSIYNKTVTYYNGKWYESKKA